MSADRPAPDVELRVEQENQGARLDAFLATRLTQFSRVQLRRAITQGAVLVDGGQAKPAYRLNSGQTVSVAFPETASAGPEPEPIPLDIVHEDRHLIVVNKPSAMVVHPAKGHWSGTLTSALAYHFGQLSTVGGDARPGVVHRLDRDTSGVIVVARDNSTHIALARQFADRTVEKEYLAIVRGTPDRDRDRVDQPIAPHPHHRERMGILREHPQSRDATTDYEVVTRYRGFALLKAMPKTGRTHQIRVHLTHIGHPILCDKLYGGSSAVTLAELIGRQAAGDRASDMLLRRQALHAHRLAFEHPASGRRVAFTAEPPQDMRRVLETLQQACDRR